MITNRSVETLPAPQLPIELLGAVPREVRLTAGGIALAVVALALAVGALVSAIVMSIAYARAEGQRELRERASIAVDAEVLEVARRGGERPRRIVTFRFEADGRTHTGRTTLRRSDQRSVSQGALIPIAYVPSHPEMIWVIGYEPDRFPLFMIPIVSVSLLVGATCIARGLRRQWGLLSEGRAAQARVTGHKKVHRDKRHVFRVSYEFQELSGATRTSRYEVGKNPPPIGTIIPIVYHRDNPQWSAMYPLQLVRTVRGRGRKD